ncbi:GMC family oxidoreductase N-terminal domain-containing protein [Nocardia sp. PE-7]|uniref:GMC family oxidoreductase N-terminal domain-containing protein n=1 Tax=Nocardia sp. PE-7 TaxID=3058426 RepID=UPI00265A72E9|nr:GMC family oxidoreductase N-terminal domain-containing protein [Nocardia sp. PE-7]WKG09005.1 GMC family oxidoreductase N-terminal domain-containing protein [Nocardia sp. PE-7]
MTSTLIVGAGSAGCVLAARLSADPARSVRVLEAGPACRTTRELLDPAHLPVGPESQVLWRYRGNLVRGKLIGGSGAINGSYFIRPPAADFAAWSAVAGPRWSFESVLPVFCDLEHDMDFGTAPGHGVGGPIPISRTDNPTEFSTEFAQRCVAAGFPEILDLNTPTGYAQPRPAPTESRGGIRQERPPILGSPGVPDVDPTRIFTRLGANHTDGFGRVPLAVSRGRRAGPAVTHLYPAMQRPNLLVTSDTMVTRLLLRGTKVIGVEWARGREHGRTYADQTVLCAGAVESAALLIRSGIGPEPLLRSLGVPIVLPAPVGAWCTDHPEIGVEFPDDEPDEPAVPLEYVLEIDDLELRPYTQMYTPGLRRVGVALMHPESTGELTLVSTDPTVPAHVDQRYLRGETDRARLRDGVALTADLLGRPIGRIDDAWLYANLGTSQHLSGTCRMGPERDERAVVDDQGRVHGIDALTVADLSVVPVPLRRGPQATTVMLAAAIADHMVM